MNKVHSLCRLNSAANMVMKTNENLCLNPFFVFQECPKAENCFIGLADSEQQIKLWSAVANLYPHVSPKHLGKCDLLLMPSCF